MSFKNFINMHSSEILTGFGLAGMITSVILGIKATPRAMKKIEKRKEELKVEKLSTWETVKTAAPCYITTGIVMAITGVSIVLPVSNEMKKGSVLATGLAISEEARLSFEEKAKEIVGEKKVEKIKEEVAHEQMRNTPIPQGSMPMIGSGQTLCHETITNQYFYSDYETVRSIINDLNFRMTNGNEPYIRVNEYCDAFNIDHVPWGDELMWKADKKLLDPMISTGWSKDGRPCMVIDFNKDDYLNL